MILTLTTATLFATYYAPSADTSDAGREPQLMPITADLTFTPVITPGLAEATLSAGVPIGLVAAPIPAKIVNGVLVDSLGVEDIMLHTFEEMPLAYEVTFKNVVYDGKSIPGGLKSYKFELPATPNRTNLVAVQPPTSLGVGAAISEMQSMLVTMDSKMAAVQNLIDTVDDVLEDSTTTAVGRSVITAATTSDARAAIGAPDVGFGTVVATIESGVFNALDLSVAGLYRIRGGTGYVTDMPATTAGLWWNVILLDTASAADANTKMFLAHGATTNVLYYRLKYGATWGAWAAISTAAALSALTQAEADTGTATTARSINAAVLKAAIATHAGAKVVIGARPATGVTGVLYVEP